jgi:hypothetical protein
MSFILAASVLLLALFAGIFLDDIGAGWRHKARYDVRSLDAW